MAPTNGYSDFSLLQKVGAEFIGTYIMLFSAAAAPILNEKYQAAENGLMTSAICAGLAVMAVILSIGHISGAHLNPSVTVAFAALRHFPWLHVPLYITAQISGSISAAFSLKIVFRPFMSGGATVPSVGTGQALAIEFIVTFFLMFVIVAVATDTRAVGELAGIAIGGMVMLNILVAGRATGGSMNPARTLGPAIATENFKGLWIYIVAPTAGAVAGAAGYTAVKLRQDTAAESARRNEGSLSRLGESSQAVVPSRSSGNSAWKLDGGSWLCLAGECRKECSELEHLNVILCYKEANQIAEFLGKNEAGDEGLV
ncbi:probable aquaporin NIP5-1 isoform X1 [Cucurbita moschata]|uniref:Probable aquaporin NIP5-1 isoform X1 n=2 Tax=Cucurbita moschata TaxID=3662 RepID=A0A6J1FPW3_CUCMO|nr:probable aquaporin NIP5-1 isoform X1 [Cucurbita moschata]